MIPMLAPARCWRARWRSAAHWRGATRIFDALLLRAPRYYARASAASPQIFIFARRARDARALARRASAIFAPRASAIIRRARKDARYALPYAAPPRATRAPPRHYAAADDAMPYAMPSRPPTPLFAVCLMPDGGARARIKTVKARYVL